MTAITTTATFQINKTTLHVLIVILPINHNIFLEIIKLGFKKTISWKKYRAEIKTEPRKIEPIEIVCLAQHLRILIGYLFFHSKW